MIFEKIKSLIVTQLEVDPEKVTPETYFVEDLGADSLDVMELVTVFEEEFGTEVDTESLESIKQVKDIVRYFESH